MEFRRHKMQHYINITVLVVSPFDDYGLGM